MSSWCLRDDIGPTLLLKKEEGLTAAARKGGIWRLLWSKHSFLTTIMRNENRKSTVIGMILPLSSGVVPHLWRCSALWEKNEEDWTEVATGGIGRLPLSATMRNGNWKSSYCCHSNPSSIFRTCTVLYFSFGAQGSRGECIYGLFDWSFRASSDKSVTAWWTAGNDNY